MIGNLKFRVYQYRTITLRLPHYWEKYIEHHKGILKGYEAIDGKMVET